jgi:hypothetical protein
MSGAKSNRYCKLCLEKASDQNSWTFVINGLRKGMASDLHTCEYGTSNFPRDICKHQALNVVQDVRLARSSRLRIGVHEVRTRTPKCLLRVLVADCGFSSPVPPPTSVASSFALAVKYCNLKGSLTQAKLALTTRTDIDQTESQKCKKFHEVRQSHILPFKGRPESAKCCENVNYRLSLDIRYNISTLAIIDRKICLCYLLLPETLRRFDHCTTQFSSVHVKATSTSIQHLASKRYWRRTDMLSTARKVEKRSYNTRDSVYTDKYGLARKRSAYTPFGNMKPRWRQS